MTFAKTGAPNSRTTQLFINYVDNARLDGMGFAPFAKVWALRFTCRGAPVIT